jgi:hypothetical protein
MIESDAAFTGKLIFGKTFLALIFSLSWKGLEGRKDSQCQWDNKKHFWKEREITPWMRFLPGKSDIISDTDSQEDSKSLAPKDNLRFMA